MHVRYVCVCVFVHAQKLQKMLHVGNFSFALFFRIIM